MKCSNCDKITEERCFATYKNKRGEIRRRGICVECRRRYAIENFARLKKWREAYNRRNSTKKRLKDAARRAEIKQLIDAIKAAAACTDCGNKFHPVAMDFDHVAGKNKAISSLVSGAYKIELIMEEIKLCDIVCACCHRIRTHERKQNHAPIKSLSI